MSRIAIAPAVERARARARDFASSARVPGDDDAVRVARLERARAKTGVERDALDVRRVSAQDERVGRGIGRHDARARE